jgi:oligoendopeptidase F
MKNIIGGMMVLVLLYSSVPQETLAQTMERSEIPVEYTWNLADLYPSDEVWNQSKKAVITKMGNIEQYKGKVGSSASILLACLKFNSDINRELSRLFCYAGMKSDQDTRNADNMAKKEELIQIWTDYNSRTSFIKPELVKLNSKTIENFIKKEPELKQFKMYLYDIQRQKAHLLSDKEEKIIAEAGLMSTSPESIYDIFSNAELPYPKIKLNDGTDVILNQSAYERYRASSNRVDREKVFQAFWGAHQKFKQTFGAQLYANVKSDLFFARVRKYKNSLMSSIDTNNIPAAVYYAQIENVNKNLDIFYRYLKLKKRMLGVDTLKYSDLYAPTVKGIGLKYSVEEAKKIVVDALKPLGKEYAEGVVKAFQNRWIDFYPTPGKTSGAYSNGSAYDVHPYILMDFNGSYDSVSTLAHELGHTMHSYYSNKYQPYPTSDYAIFVAEVASTFNEILLMEKMLRDIPDDDLRLSLLMERLDSIKGTVFRQTQFAEFELKIHEKVENGEPLTGEVLTEIYGNILKKYYGVEQGITVIDELYNVEWAYIPHFYNNFYVYQYSTSYTASTALAEKVFSGEKVIVDRYIAFISSGSSDYPIELLKKAGVDMTTDKPFNKTMDVMNRTMDEIEKILDKKGQ